MQIFKSIINFTTTQTKQTMRKPIFTKPIELSRWHFICLLAQQFGFHPVLEQEKLEDLLSNSIIYN